MPITGIPRQYLKAFRFRVRLLRDAPIDTEALETLARTGGGEDFRFPLVSMKSEEGRRCVLAMGLEEGNVATLAEHFDWATKGRAGVAVVWLIGRGFDNPDPEKRTGARAFLVFFERWEWLPLDLDAASENSAMERIVLSGVRYRELDAADRMPLDEEKSGA